MSLYLETSNQFVDSFLKSAKRTLEQELYPPADLIESKDNFTLEVELPGVKKEAIKINLEKSILTISGEKLNKNAVSQKKERTYRKFSRNFKLSDDIDKKQIHASFEDGVLFLKLPKKEEDYQKSIEIE